MYTSNEIEDIASYWRRSWSDRSRSDMVLKLGPGFFLWRANADGNKGSGMFYKEDIVGSVVADKDMADSIANLINETNHEKFVVVVLVFENENRATCLEVEKLEPTRQQVWFEMDGIRKRSYQKSVWIPVRASQKLIERGESGSEGYLEDFFGLGSVMFSRQTKIDVSKLGWMDIGISNDYKGGQITRHFQAGEQVTREELFNFRVPLIGKKIVVDIEEPLKDTLVRNPADREHSFWLNVNTDSGSS